MEASGSIVRVNGQKRRPWHNEFDSSLSPDWVVALLVIAILAAAAFGAWFNDMYANGYGIFAP